MKVLRGIEKKCSSQGCDLPAMFVHEWEQFVRWKRCTGTRRQRRYFCGYCCELMYPKEHEQALCDAEQKKSQPIAGEP